MSKCTYNFMWHWMGWGRLKGVKSTNLLLERGRERERGEVMLSHLVQGGMLVKCHVSFMNMYIHTGTG